MSSSQALVRVGEMLDMYYTDHENCKKQSIPVEYDTRYTQAFTNLTSGVSVFTLPPSQGYRHVVIVLGFNAGSLTAPTAGGVNALQRGWGYQAIAQLSFRIGGSSQYFLSGQQMLARNLRLCRTKEQRNSILSLGGQQISGGSVGTAATTTAQFAYIPVSIWCPPAEDGIAIPLPSDLLSQQIQITCQLNPPSAYWLVNGTGTPAALPTAFDVAYFQVEQLQMKDRGMALANRVNMNEHMYSMPLPTFDQQEVVFSSVSTATPANPVPLTLTGFRAGEVKKIQIWLEPLVVAANSNLPAQTLRWVLPAGVEILYAGLKYSTYLNGSSAIWNLIDGTAPAAVDQSVLTTSSTSWSSTSGLSQWAELPFAQPTGADYEAEVLVHGKEINNMVSVCC